jgi:hypothetical protein
MGPVFSTDGIATDTLAWTLSTDDFEVLDPYGLNYITGYRVYGPDGELLDDTLAPGTRTWVSPSLNGYYDVSAVDVCENESARLRFSSECTGTEPVITIAFPGDNEIVFGTVYVQGTAAASEGRTISRVQLKIDDWAWTDPGSPASWSRTWDTGTENNGGHTVTVGAYDSQGCYSQKTIAVTVSNADMAFPD